MESALPQKIDGRYVSSTQRRPLSSLLFIFGLLLAISAFALALTTFFILSGLTPLIPTDEIVTRLIYLNGIVIVALIAVIFIELIRVFLAKKEGKAGSHLHRRIVLWFSLIAAIPSLLLAIVAALTLDQGLDRWFSQRTQSIVNFSLTVAQSYVREHAQVLRADLITMGGELDKAQALFESDPARFVSYLNTQSSLRALPFVALLKSNGETLMRARTPFPDAFIAPPSPAFTAAKDGEATLISPGDTNQVSGLIKLKNFDDLYLYIARTIDPKVIQYLNVTQENVEEYRQLEDRRYGVQIAFGLMFAGMAIVILLVAIWVGLVFSNRLVSPIRRLIHASDQVSQGNLYVQVPIKAQEGDLGNLAKTFNHMIARLKTQREEILTANEQIDHRRRFTEAVLSGVSAGVIGIKENGQLTIANRTALHFLGLEKEALHHSSITHYANEIVHLFNLARATPNKLFEDQIMLTKDDHHRSYNVRALAEKNPDGQINIVMTFNDITALVSAQRSAAWADIARRIAHEIKNPLTPIQLAAERITRRFGKQIMQDKEIFDQCTQTILRQVDDIGSMVDEFSSFARMPKPQFERHNLYHIAKEITFMMQVGRDDVSITLLPELNEEAGDTLIFQADIDERMLRQVLTNLIKNSLEASENKTDNENIKINIILHTMADDPLIHIFILDNGVGFPEANRQKLLEPYMTTRQKGTGLGLAIVKRIIEEHHGTIELKNATDYYMSEYYDEALENTQMSQRCDGACVYFTLKKYDRQKEEPPSTHQKEDA